MEKFFKLKENGTNVKTELAAGSTTFLSMVYILAVNPSILADAGMNGSAVFTATAVSAAAATLFMAFFANYPIALASGMGLNAYFAYSVCIPLAKAGVNNPWEIALTAVFVEGIIFILLSLCSFREKLVNDVPNNLKYGITAGVGLFITLIGLNSAGIVIPNDSTLLSLGALARPQFVLAVMGVMLICIFQHHHIKGFILWATLATWGLGMIAQAVGWYQVDPAAGTFSLYPAFSVDTILPEKPYFFDFNFGWIASHFLEFAVITFSFLFIDLFDTVGALIGISAKGYLVGEDGKLEHVKGALLADACGTVVGAVLGTSTVTSYIESCAGVANGGRTGLASVTTAGLFIIALFFAPVFLAIPGFATAPALIYVGLLMIETIKNMQFGKNIADDFSGFVAIIMMPFSYSIANGIMFGILSWVVLKIFTKGIKDIPPIMWISSIIFVLRIITLV
ncbi:MAG: NCS2 family permease [Anaerovoracaceae bacterium]